jgi:hypothetical protein
MKCTPEGNNPCRGCLFQKLNCTYNCMPRRGNVLSVLQRRQCNTQPAASYLPETNFDGCPTSSSLPSTRAILPPQWARSCLDLFFTNLYPSNPFLSRHKAQEAVVSMERSTESYCLIVALCAYVKIQANLEAPSAETGQTSVTSGQALLAESERIRNKYDFRENPTYMTVLTSWFYCVSYFALAKQNTAWIYLREASTQVQLLNKHGEMAYKNDEFDFSSECVLVWLCSQADW